MFGADIYIIQECENPEMSTDEKYKNWSGNFLWTGENKKKGLGVFAREDIKIADLNWNSDGLQFFIACTLNNEINLLAVWCHGARQPTFQYIGQFWKYLQINKHKLGNAIIAGDFNSNVIWDKRRRNWNHSDVIRELSELNIESIYHRFQNEEQGVESIPTFYLQKKIEKPYHIDYVFASTTFHNSAIVHVGNAADWIALSDHMPVLVTLGG